MSTSELDVLIVYNLPPDPFSPTRRQNCLASVAGVLAEVRAVEQALSQAGISHRTIGVRELRDCAALLARAPERLVVNLVEGFDENAEDACLFPAMCQSFGKACTGADSACLALSLDKGVAGAMLARKGVPVPAGTVIPVGRKPLPEKLPLPPWIVKPCRSDASEGIESKASVFFQPGVPMLQAVQRIHREFRQAALVEQLVGERELNISLLERRGSVEVLPLAEIDFSAFTSGAPRVVDYAAKWDTDSFAYANTPRIIPAPLPEDWAEAVRTAARQTWDILGCRDYARVDMRLSRDGHLYVLEVNPNPDISPDAGFAAALDAAGIGYTEFVTGLIENARTRLKTLVSPRHAGEPGKEVFPEPVRQNGITIRTVTSRERDDILRFTEATGFFRPVEVDIAREVLDEALRAGPTGDYQSFAALMDECCVGWVCFGRTPCTVGTFDIYWLVVDPAVQGRGIGRTLMNFAEASIADHGGSLAVVETSGGEHYVPTRAFYERIGYIRSAVVPDFYAPDDPKVIYTKYLSVKESV